MEFFRNFLEIPHFFEFFDFYCRITSRASFWVEKLSHLAKTDKLVIFIERFHRFQKIPELLEFLDSDCRIGFSDQNWVGKMPHILILVQNDHIRRKIGNRLIKISWNQLIFLSHQSWLESHLYWIYNWFLKIPTGNLLFRAFYGCIKWADWPS